MDNNGSGIHEMLERAKAQAAAQEQLNAILHQTLQQPHSQHRLGLSVSALVREGPLWLLLVAVPTGERYDIVLSPASVQQFAAAARQIEREVQEAEAGRGGEG